MSDNNTPISLRSISPLAGVEIDAEAGIIRNASIMSMGIASGHGFEIDDVMLSQVASQIGEAAMRYGHPLERTPTGTVQKDPIGTHIGRVTNARLDGDRIRGDIHFGSHAANVPGLGDVRGYLMELAKNDPTAFGLSVVFAPASAEKVNGKTYMRSRGVLAVDVVGQPAANPAGLLSTNAGDVPAVQSVFERSSTMEPTTTPAQPAATAAPEPAVQANATVAMATPAPAPDPIALEAKRIESIKNIATLYGLDDGFVTEQIALSAGTINDVMVAARAALAKRKLPPAISVGEDQNLVSLSAAVGDAMSLRMGVSVEKPHDRTRELRGMTLLEIGRVLLAAQGVSTVGLSRQELASRMLRPIALAGSHTTSDFPSIMANSLRKQLREAYAEAESTWQMWAGRRTVSDFKTVSNPILGGVPTPPVVREGAEYTYVTMGEANETYQLAKYGELLQLTWEMLINDDLGAFVTRGVRFANAARRLENDLAYAPITGNQVMTETGQALFNVAVHANQAAVNAAISVASLGIARTAMRRQRGIAPQAGVLGPVLNLTPRHLLVPVEQETLAQQVIGSIADPANANPNVVNPFNRSLNIISDARLSVNSTTAWYLVADNSAIDTVVVAFLEGNEAPFIEEQDAGPTVDARVFKLRHVCAARALDYRGMFRNLGV